MTAIRIISNTDFTFNFEFKRLDENKKEETIIDEHIDPLSTQFDINRLIDFMLEHDTMMKENEKYREDLYQTIKHLFDFNAIKY